MSINIITLIEQKVMNIIVEQQTTILIILSELPQTTIEIAADFPNEANPRSMSGTGKKNQLLCFHPNRVIPILRLYARTIARENHRNHIHSSMHLYLFSDPISGDYT